MLEKIVCNRLTEFLETNKLLSNFQFGFRKKHSTLHPLLLFSNKITEALKNKEHCIAIFCDLKKPLFWLTSRHLTHMWTFGPDI